MGMTLTEKILAKAAGRSSVKPGDIVEASIDLAMLHDALGSLTFPIVRDLGIRIWDSDKVVVAIDHAAPPSSLGHAEWVADTIRFAREYKIRHFYNMQGVAHQIIPEEGLVRPGMVAVGTDSHTCTYGALGAFATGIGSTEMAWVLAKGSLWFRVPATIKVVVDGSLPARVMAKDVMLKVLSVLGVNGATYKALEFTGEAIRRMSMDGRLALCNMAVETGAKNGIVEPDEVTWSYLKERYCGPMEPVSPDEDAVYDRVIRIDASGLSPMLACPHSPGNVVPVNEVAGTKVDQVVIGTCTGGRMEDFRAAAEIIRGRKVPPFVRCLVIPASAKIYRQLLEENLIKVFLDAGCVMCNPQCGPCAGLHYGLLAPGEVCVGTHNRNFMGRMGSPLAQVYLASAATAAAAAVTGKIVDPRDM
ncbi:MAG TPA: 3-isopropylmalate dehydratase large subunit [Firmicutes bacterium]|nr:3-isopropylmalate dehydratase large subunit [Candidatus Fermentithermobacillaceae bacterium]